ncbi:LysR family transcriptional regulator [Ruegeria sp. 2205SS24-7]|uniref:LysR family transcriptional regulator n=1 Tax=Ruegeria discodermiae TaxID=3064389 RepID=UPI0027413C7D|nr:LysR family transcriptional regulator [Ruegeria sp. 2205SS24-7]MDP5217979.1 LysR family transcriptional regulator [Ruegeria sp. 2205SS24-7]
MARQSLVTKVGEADINLLRIFKSVVESRGLSAAETELNIGRSTISKYLSNLEIRLGLKLCNRGPGGFSLTEDGAKVLAAAERLLLSVSDFQSEVNEIKQDLVGRIHVALFDQCASNPDSHLARAISTFNVLAPDVQIELSLEPPNVIETKLLSGDVDVGIIAEHRVSKSLNYVPIYTENMYLFCGQGHPFFDRDQANLTLDDVRAARYAGISVNSPNLKFGQSLKLRRAAKVQSEHALSILILSGRYIGFLPDHFTRSFVEQGQMKMILPEMLHYRATFSAVNRRSPEPPRITQTFLQTLVKEHSR